MAKRVIKSARGKTVDFDLLAIKHQIANKPVPVSVSNRRNFIDEKDGTRTAKKIEVQDSTPSTNSALDVAKAAAKVSASANKQ